MAEPLQNVKTLTDILALNSRFDYNKVLYYTETADKTLIIPDTNVFQVYIRLISRYVKQYSVTDEQREYYKRRPYILSTDIYGTPALGWLILLLNDRECASKFYLKDTVRLIPMDVLENIYDSLVTKESKKLNINWTKYNAKIGQTV